MQPGTTLRVVLARLCPPPPSPTVCAPPGRAESGLYWHPQAMRDLLIVRLSWCYVPNGKKYRTHFRLLKSAVDETQGVRDASNSTLH